MAPNTHCSLTLVSPCLHIASQLGNTALNEASFSGYLEVVKALLKGGANMEAKGMVS